MANVTLYVPDPLKRRMDEYDEVRWSSAIRNIIEEKLDNLEESNELAKKSRLTEDDVKRLSAKVNKGMARHAEALLSETRS